jgi:basic amino acid/polyamine antiporter, APA family
MVFALLGDLTLIASVTDFAVYVVFLAVNATLIVLRLRDPRRPRPFRVPGSLGRIPMLPVLGFAAAALMIPQLEARSLLIGLSMVGVGLVAQRTLDRRLS